MKTNWQTKKLGEICSLVTRGISPQYIKEGGVIILNQRCIRNHEINYSEAKRHDTSKIFAKEKLLQSGDVLVNSTGVGTLGRVAQIKQIKQPTIVDSHITIVRPIENIFDINYFGWIMIFIEEIIKEIGTGSSGQIELSRITLKNIEITYPQLLSEQRRIVKILDEKMGEIREAKQLREESIKDTEKILSQTLREIFEEGKLKSWEKKTIGDVFTLNYGKGLSKIERSEKGKYFAYGANGPLGKTDKFLIEAESIIVGRKGSAGEVTRVSGKFWPTDVTYFVTETDLYDIDFAFYLFKYLDFTQYSKGVKPGINRNEIYSLKFNLPSLTEQKQIVKKLKTLSEKIQTLRDLQTSQLSDIKALEKAYLREAFNGELV